MGTPGAGKRRGPGSASPGGWRWLLQKGESVYGDDIGVT